MYLFSPWFRTIYSYRSRFRLQRILLSCLLGGISFNTAADVNGDMNNFFNKLGFASNTSQPQVWQGQAAGYASGGSLYARTQVKSIWSA